MLTAKNHYISVNSQLLWNTAIGEFPTQCTMIEGRKKRSMAVPLQWKRKIMRAALFKSSDQTFRSSILKWLVCLNFPFTAASISPTRDGRYCPQLKSVLQLLLSRARPNLSKCSTTVPDHISISKKIQTNKAELSSVFREGTRFS